MKTPFPQDQKIYFNNGSCRIIEDVVEVEEGKWTHVWDSKGFEYIVNPANVLFIRVRSKKMI